MMAASRRSPPSRPRSQLSWGYVDVAGQLDLECDDPLVGALDDEVDLAVAVSAAQMRPTAGQRAARAASSLTRLRHRIELLR
jgi:hypothetical protein